MALVAGFRLGPYEVVRPLGAGGMGVVYRARDTRLARDVAIKVLPDGVGQDPARLARFRREAQLLASLNHPNIGAIYGLEDAGSRQALILELIEGPTLAERLAGGPLSPEQVWPIAKQIAEALSAAHEVGIVHLDLKPANVVVRPDGVVKVLDFGLATAITSTSPGIMASDAPTLTAATRDGEMFGTPSYMSPEQFRGAASDRPTDIWAFGCVVFEMLTGRRAFRGASIPDVIAAVLAGEVDWNALPPGTPVGARRLLQHCLSKDLKHRLRDIGDLRLMLDDALNEQAPSPAADTEAASRTPLRLAAALAGLLVLVLLSGLAGWKLIPKAGPTTAASLLRGATLTPITTDPGYEGEPTFSPDGETIAYVSDRTGNFDIFLRQVSGGPDINLTANPADDVQPAFSPDGKQIAFVSTRDGSSELTYGGPYSFSLGGSIWVMTALGGAPKRIAEAGNFPSWSPDGTHVLFAGGTWFRPKLYAVPASGGEPREIPITFESDKAVPAHIEFPRFSPNGRRIAFEGTPGTIYLVAAEGGNATALVAGRCPAWSPDSASLIYSNTEPGRNASLWRVSLSHTPTGTPVTPEPLTIGRGADMNAAVAPGGRRIAFAALDSTSNLERRSFDAETGVLSGSPEAVTSGGNHVISFGFSPDGQSVVFDSVLGSSSHLWKVEIGNPPFQLTSDPHFEDAAPKWSPDGRSIAFMRRPSDAGGINSSLWVATADGGSPRPLVEKSGSFQWMPDGRRIVHFSWADQDFHVLNLETKLSRPLTDEPRAMQILALSADGAWLVYQSTIAGSVDLHAVPTSGGPARVVVASSHLSYHPFLSPSGRWVYYFRDHKDLYRVPGPAQRWRRAEPEKVTDFRLKSGEFLEDPQLSADGRHLLYAHGRLTGDIWLLDLGGDARR